MKKIGVVFDSTCGKTKEELEKDNSFLVPLVVYINGEEYKAGVDLDNKSLFEKMIKGNEVKIRTSTPLRSDYISAFDSALKEYDEVVFIGMSRKFSSTTSMAEQIIEEIKEYKGKIHVYDSLMSSPWFNFLYESIMNYFKNSDDIDVFFKKMKEVEKNVIALLSPGDIYWFYNGGRITKNQYIIANLLKVFPILIIENGEIDQKKVIKVRSLKKVIEKMVQQLSEEIKKRENIDLTKYKIGVLKSDKVEYIKLIIEKFKKELNLEDDAFEIVELSPEQSAHMGPNSIGVAILPSFK